tara:strand:- start:754 stop:1149 length:396 start_codon:yes stop_codon:yes gene_type:complete
MKRYRENYSYLWHVKDQLENLGLGHFNTELITDAGEDSNKCAIKVTYADGPFGYQMEILDRHFSLELFMMYFKNRRNYLMLTPAEREEIANQNTHPEEWEQGFVFEKQAHRKSQIAYMEGKLNDAIRHRGH